jgi:hypothetical protein
MPPLLPGLSQPPAVALTPEFLVVKAKIIGHIFCRIKLARNFGSEGPAAEHGVQIEVQPAQ